MSSAAPHYEIASSELADWLERQGVDRWWTVDGDPLLTGRLSLPCPGDELALELRRINQPLLLLDTHRPSEGEDPSVRSDDLDKFVKRLDEIVPVRGEKPKWLENRNLFLRWKEQGEEWLLIEDIETTEQVHGEVAYQQGKA